MARTSRSSHSTPRGFTLSVTAAAGAGKTEFGLNLPRPLTCVTVDPNTIAVAHKLGLTDEDGDSQHDDFTLKHMTMPALAFDEREDIKEEAAEKWESLRDFLRPIVKGKEECRSVLLDTGSEMYNLGFLATFGKNDQVSPEARRNMSGPLNSRWKGIVQALEQRGIIVCLLHRAKNAWATVVEDTDRGERETRRMLTGPFDVEREGYNGTPFIISTEVFLAFDPMREAKNVSGKFGMKVVRSQQRPGIISKEYWGREKIDGARVRRSSFAYLATQLYPGTTLADWGGA